MARGWESKDVESRIQDSHDRHLHNHMQATPEERARVTKLHLLEQQQARLTAEMGQATTDRMLDLLRREMAWVEEHIRLLQ
ncbi:MAG TPA: hypothetical protein PKJ41_06305 [Bryobacteraceae bacterium]|nr:hypothetical protein [Bryobacteraceae bacterium]HPT27079.1 hypothetical protein [Bryobacteraceae bacterium]